MAENFRNFTAVLNIDSYDADGVAVLLSDVFHIKKKVCDGILTCLDKLPVGVVDGILSITQWKCIKKAVESKIVEVGISCDICEKQLEKKCNLKVELSGIELHIKNCEKI